MEEPEYPKPPKAYKNLSFLNSHDARSVRVLCELIEPEQRLRRHRVQHTVVFFGSARSVAGDKAHEVEHKLLAMAEQETNSKRKASLLERARKVERLSHYYDQAVELARRFTEWSLAIEKPEERFYVCSGGGPGMMEAANRGAHLAGGDSLALGISLPFEQHINPYCKEDLSFEFHYFFMRKFWFLYPAKALVVFPGGFGTMDELFEVLTLIQTQKAGKKVPILLYGSEFWNDILNFDAFVKWGVISESDLDLFHIVDDVESAMQFLKDELTNHTLNGSF